MENRNLKLVKLAGGIGNQMFQYAFGLYLEHKYHCQVKYFGEESGSRLPLLGCKVEYATSDELRQLGYAPHGHTAYRLRRRLLRAMPWLCRRVVVENGSNYQAQLPSEARVFDGYWQSYRYFTGIEADVRRLFCLDAYSQTPLADDIRRSPSVAVHIRRGDYLHGANARLFEACPLSYFEQAMQLMGQRVTAPVFYIFSNDIEWTRTHLHANGHRCVYVENNGPEADLHDLAAMALCQHAIISNSTFSWWGAWLTDHASKWVVAPRRWYKPKAMNAAAANLTPPTWISI